MPRPEHWGLVLSGCTNCRTLGCNLCIPCSLCNTQSMPLYGVPSWGSLGHTRPNSSRSWGWSPEYNPLGLGLGQRALEAQPLLRGTWYFDLWSRGNPSMWLEEKMPRIHTACCSTAWCIKGLQECDQRCWWHCFCLGTSRCSVQLLICIGLVCVCAPCVFLPSAAAN